MTGHYLGGLHDRKYSGDAGYDLSMPHDTWILGDVAQENQYQAVNLGVYVAPPDGYWLELTGRSSARARGMLVHQGIIDHGYRGELIAFVRNLTGRAMLISKGERIAQLIPHPIININWKQVLKVEDLPQSDRGENGLGSTGR